MKPAEKKSRRTIGISMTTAIIFVAVISVLTTSTVVIIEGGVTVDEVMEECGDVYFDLLVQPAHRNSTIDETVSYEISFEPYIYLYAPCKLEVLDMYDGVTSSIEPDIIYPGETAILNLTGMIEGDFHRQIVGTYNGDVDSVEVTLSVDDEGGSPGDFHLEADPLSQTVDQNQPAYYTITVEPIGDFDGKVELFVLDAFDGVISILRPNTISPGETAVLILTPMIPGEFSRIIRGTSGDVTREVEVYLYVNMDPKGSY